MAAVGLPASLTHPQSPPLPPSRTGGRNPIHHNLYDHMGKRSVATDGASKQFTCHSPSRRVEAGRREGLEGLKKRETLQPRLQNLGKELRMSRMTCGHLTLT